MENDDTLKFVLCSGEEFPISPQSSRLNDIRPDIFRKLYLEKQYKVESNVCKESFLQFLKYLTDGKQPTITESNRPDLFILSEEFQIMKNIFYQKRIDYLHSIKLLQDETTDNKSQIEDFISLNLDEYLVNVGDKLLDLPITTLYNILNNQRRNLTQHNLCYNLIKQNYDKNHNLNIFSLLPSLDGKKLSEENLNDSISSQEFRLGFIVKIEYSIILDLKKEIEQHKKELKTVSEQHKKEIKKISEQILELKKSLPNQTQGEPGQIAVLNQQKNGYIWKIPPFSIRFKACLTNHAKSFNFGNFQWGNSIPLNKVIYDSNNAFDVNKHVYKIPVTGKWLFFGQVQNNEAINNGTLHVGILINGITICQNGFNKDIKQFDSLSCSGEAECREGDLIYLHTYHKTEFNSQNTYLQGFYLST